MPLTRREFVTLSATALLAAPRLAPAVQAAPAVPSLAGKLGITMSSVQRLMVDDKPLKYTMLEWPRMLREELDLTVIDLNSGAIDSHDPAQLEQVRKAADRAGCVLTNMKINRGDVDIGHADSAVRAEALRICKHWIDTSAQLGLRWARPLPFKDRPDRQVYVASYRELSEYAAARNVQMLIENYGWLAEDAEEMPRLMREIGVNIALGPDTGNWANDTLRRTGLTAAFPHAVTCDFKAGRLGPNGEHSAWDLKACFDIAWRAGFRGPWCFEHAHTDRATLFRELALLRDLLRRWMREAE